MPDEETSDDPEPEPGGEPSAEGLAQPEPEAPALSDTSPATPAQGDTAQAPDSPAVGTNAPPQSAPEAPEAPPPEDSAPAEPAPREASAPSQARAAEITGEILISDLLRADPNAARVLAEEFDLPCYRCPARFVETLASGITYRGLKAEQILTRLRVLRGEPEPEAQSTPPAWPPSPAAESAPPEDAA